MSAKCSILLVVTLIALSCIDEGACTVASFFGDSYIRWPIENAHSETDIKLHFRTHQSEGLLLLAAGSPDYCVVELRMGMVRVRTDLGAGEAALSSPPGIRFDDWKWHNLHLSRKQEHLRLTIDGLYTTASQTPGRYFELNINSGIFLGGVGTFTDIFFGNLGSYRGCLRHVHFNNLDVFSGAREHFDPLNIYGVTWDCSAEFGATSDQAISFLHNTSFMALPTLPARSEGRISFDIRTRGEDALLIYNSGRLHSSDFFAVEMLHGNIKLTVNKGDGAVEIMSVDKINDGLWHQVEVVVELSGARVSLDGVKEETYHSGTNRFLDLQGYLYVGGVSLQARGQAISNGLRSLSGIYGPAGSLIGCMQNVKVNGVLQGFTEAQVTRGLMAECVWTYPCLSNPCIRDAVCLEEGFYTYRCVCDQAECRKHTLTESNLPPVPVNDVLAIQDVVVREGGRALITIQNIDILFDYAALGIRESSIVFRVVNTPEQGEVQVNIGRHEAQQTFTLLDMQSGKVSYLHHGSEVPVDSVGLELEFFPSPSNSSTLPHKLRQKYGFTLIIKVAPWNDKPQIMLPPDDTLVMVQNTDVRVTSKLFNVLDKDDEAQNLEYTVEYPKLFDTGYFEISDSLGVRARIVSFTQEDVNEGRLKYVHRGNLQADIKLQVSDGKDMGEPRILHIRGVPLELRPVANHGIVITPGGGALIFRDNLTFATNVPNQDIDIRYEIIEPAYNGEVQRMQYADNQWITVTTFSQRHIDKSRLRYIHSYPSHHTTDYFQFRVSALNERTELYNFTIRIIPSKVGVVNNKMLQLRGVRVERLTRAHLLANSSIPTHGQRVIKYSTVTLPRHGNLYKLEPHRGSRFQKHKFSIGENFTQEDINDQRIMYRLHKALDNTVRDSFQFTVAIPGDTSDVQTFSIKYTPSDSDVQFINNGLTDVLEGGSKVITMEELFAKSKSKDVYHFSILSSPEHGVLQLIDNKTGDATNRNCTSFTTQDIRYGRVLYHHDDSENEDDSFNYLATPTITELSVITEIQEFTGIFEIKIQLRNDNKPERVVNQVFTVVSGRGRLLTAEDILYTDKDIDSDPNEIMYMWKDVQNGELVMAEDKTTPVTQFKQRDLIDGKIYFKHHGANYGRAVITVTDGSHIVKDVFEVRASEPYLMFAKNTGLSVVRGESTPIQVNNLSINTNLDLDDKDVKFTIPIPPSHGRIKKNGMDKSKFHLGDLRSDQLVYEHDGSMNLQDTFSVVVRAEELRQETEVKVKIVLESHGNPPRLINSKMVMVDEKQMAYITSDELRVSHPETPDQEIIYTIDNHPQYGEIMLENGLAGQDLKMFTQADINARRLKYIHTQLGHTSDELTFDVTNGIQPLQDLELVFEIIPKVIPMDVANIAIEEGASIALTPDIIHITNKHFERDELIFMIVKSPENGTIESFTSPGVALGRFMWSQVKAEGIFYVHDGSDSVHDDFSLMAMSVTSEKKSNPQTIGVTIDPVNDQIPVVTRNKILDVWTGSMTPIGPENLKTEDNDSAPYDLMYIITKPSNGDIVLASNPQQNIVNFTQAHLNRGDVLFVHSGAAEGEFDYQVIDGVNKADRKKFRIRAKQLILEMKTNKPLEVYPGILQPITTDHLLAKTNDNNQTRPITYIMGQPRFGKLAVRRNNISVEVDTFTQQDIAEGIIYYHHDGEMRTWQQNETLEMEVSTAYAQSLSYEFTVLISYGNINENNRAQLIKVGSPMVEEGQQVTISKEYLDVTPLRRRLQNELRGSPHVTYVITELPKHGVLVIDGQNATIGTVMSQRDVNRNNVIYFHDDSDTFWDIFKFALNIEISGGLTQNTNGGRQKQNNVFNITIIPINDQPLVFLTKEPEITIIQEQVTVITPEMLNTEDADTPPDGIMYKVVGPNHGMLVYKDAPDTRIQAFTQKDINSGHVLFIPNGGPQHDAFYFEVTDGQFTSPHIVFQIIVTRLTLELVNASDIELLQGEVRETIKPENLIVETNGDKSKIVYNVTKPPAHGQLFMNNLEVYQFSQLNVEKELVSYIQTDLTVYEDHFEFILYDTVNMILEQRMNITVKPRVISNTPDLPLGEDLVISVDMLDAGALAELSASNPLYDVVEPPMFGNLYKIIPPRVRRDTRKKRKNGNNMEDGEEEEMVESEARKFTHQDIVDGHVSYRQNGDLNEPATDSFKYIVSTPTTQPAPGKFQISLVVGDDGGVIPESENTPSPEVKAVAPIAKEVKPTSKSKVPVIDKNKPTPADPRNKVGNDHFIILIIVCVITVIVIVGFIVGRCMRAHRKRQELAAAKEDSRTPLSQQNPPMETQPPVDSPDSPSPPVPVIVTPDFEEGDLEGDRAPPDRSRSPSMTPSAKSRSHSPHRYPPHPMSYSRDDYRVQGSSTPPPARSPKLVHSSPMSKSQDTLKTEVSKTVPTCKVTPLFDGDNYGSLGRRTSGSGTLKRGESNTGSLKRDQVTYDWDSVDPELLQHCRTTNPVLHENKYWV